jgi:HD-GYP domain-containing protein (c-di-GMP phosphodiesterase class II)
VAAPFSRVDANQLGIDGQRKHMTKDLGDGKPASARSLIMQAQSLGDLLRREFGVPFLIFNRDTGDCLVGEPALTALTHIRDRTLTTGGGGDVDVRLASDGRFHLFLRVLVDRESALIAEGQIAFQSREGQLDEPTIRLQQRMFYRWLSAVRDRLLLEGQLRRARRSERDRVLQNSTTWEALRTLNSVAGRLRARTGHSNNHEQILQSAFGFSNAQSLYWIPSRSDSPVLAEGTSLIKDGEARQLAHALGKCPELRAPAPLFFNRVQLTSWGWRFPQVRNLIAFMVTDHGPLGWLVAMNKHSHILFRRSDAALLLPFVALLELHLRWSQRNKDLKALLVGLTQSLANALDAKDAYTFGHSERVARIAVELGKEMGLQGEELGQIYLAGLLHDVGKIGVKDTILQKRGSLTLEEQEQVREHVMIGYWILAELRPIRNLLPGVLHHHERVDGTGYPAGLAHDQIPLLARILAVADAYDAMSHQRPYRESLPYHRVEETLIAGAGSQWDKAIVDAFLRCRQRIEAVSQRPIKSAVRRAVESSLTDSKNSPFTGPHRKNGLLDPVARAFKSFSEMHHGEESSDGSEESEQERDA